MFCNEIWTKWYKKYANECQIKTAMQVQVTVSLFGSDSQIHKTTHLLQNFILIHHAFLLNTNSNDKSM